MIKENFVDKKIFLRVDFNIPLDSLDTLRIEKTVETVNFLLKNSKYLCIGTHLGRPLEGDHTTLSINKILPTIKNYFKEIKLVKPEKIGKNKFEILENLRFYNLEKEYFEKNFDVIVFDAFSVSHRKCNELDSNLPIFKGFSIEKEMKLANEVKNCDLIIIGGAKIDKLKILPNLISNQKNNISKKVMVLGKLAKKLIIDKKNISGKNSPKGNNFLGENCSNYILPADFLCLDNTTNKNYTVLSNLITESDKTVDIGPLTIKLLDKVIEDSNSIFFNGPPGIFEFEYNEGTKKILELLKNKELKGCKVYIGGGDTNAAVKKLGYSFKNQSTGGGALMECLSGEELIAIEQIRKKKENSK